LNFPCCSLRYLQKQLDLCLVCSKCSVRDNETTYQCREVEHKCMHEILLARDKSKKSKAWRKVGRRPGFPNPARYEVCRYYVVGAGCHRHKNHCTFAWSREEAAVWNFERQHQLERRVLKALVLSAQATGCPGGPLSLGAPSTAGEILSEFGGQFQEICWLCFCQSPPRISLEGLARVCEVHWTWKALLVHVVADSSLKKQYVPIRPCPELLPRLDYCRFVSRNAPCKHGLQRCCYAHSEVEMAVWEAERRHELARADLLLAAAPGGKSSECLSQLCPPPQAQFYCRVCLVTFSSQESFENHCSSAEHAYMLSADALVQWTHRPDGLGEHCTQAHSTAELEEWIQRVKVARKNKKSAKEDGLLAYQDRLIAEYQESCNEVFVLSEQVDGVTVTCKQPLRLQSENRKTKYKWSFKVHSQLPLCHVALLKRDPGATFFLAGDGLPRGLTYLRGERFPVASPSTRAVEVCMECCTFGVYDQWVVFDFGTRPVLVRKIQAKIGCRETPRHVPALPGASCLVDFERWHSGNRVIVPCVQRTGDSLDLLAKYKAPALSLGFQPGGAAPVPITRLNYRERMHDFLFREEEAEQNLITKLNLQVTITPSPMLQTLSRGMQFALPGDLYAEVPTPFALTPDTNEGYLLNRSVTTAFLAPVPPTDNRVFEVKVEKKVTTEKSLWLSIPQRCCQELGLRAGVSRLVQIQFQIDQLQFRHWHHAVDCLLDERLVLPDVATCSIPHSPRPHLFGNAKQKLAVSFITGQATGPRQVPPLLIYGPFGTGKTFTLAMATLEILQQPNTRVLICTHTNSAADIYIREYFHEYVVSGHPGAVPLCIKYMERPVGTTDPITQMYCCLAKDQSVFRHPTPAEIDRHRIIITTSMLSRDLRVPPGYFTHILIDEAAQMLECEALIPLSYATLETRVVLAGDHMQITPKLFCLGGEQSADHTLLNRLFQYYQKEKHEVAKKSRIIFNENYRSTAGIIEFVSQHFYVGKGNAIQASGNIPAHPEIYPLMFCHVSGCTERHMSSTSWYNTSEITQVIEKVKEMCQKWPDEWGPREPKSICVVSYGIQVQVIRQELRKQQLGEVMVENYENLPGREFRVIIISTVHTKESLLGCASRNLEFFNEARVLNTVMTRAQSQVVAVGDAVALCSYGQCSKLWKRFIQECIEKRSVSPETLTLAQIKQVVSDKESWARRGARQVEDEDEEEEDSDTDSWASEADLNAGDPILQELLDESKNALVTVSEEGLLNVRAAAPAAPSAGTEYISYPARTMQEYLHMHPNLYKRCELVKEGFDKAVAFTLDDSPPLSIQIKGRVNCGMAFTGDEVLVWLQAGGGAARPQGKVVGVLKEAERERVFACMMDEFDPRVMIPIDPSVTKIYVPGLRGKPKVVPIRRRVRDTYQVVSCERITQEMRRSRLFCVQVISWREGFYYPLGIITEILPMAFTLEEGLKILSLEYNLPKQYPSPVTKELAKCASLQPNLSKGKVRDCRGYLTFTVDPQGSRDLDDAISVQDLGDHYEIGIHIADVAAVVHKDSALDKEARKRGATYYTPGKQPLGMLPPRLSQDLCSLLPQKDRRVISLFVTIEKAGDQVMKGVFAASTIRSDRQLTYEEAEGIIRSRRRGEAMPLCFDTVEDCVAVAYRFSRVHRKFRLQEDCYYDQLDEDCSLGQQGSHRMVQEFMIMFNSFVAELLTSKADTKSVAPLRCQLEPNPQQMAHMKSKYGHMIPLSLHLSHHLGRLPAARAPAQAAEFSLLTPLWQHLQSAARARDFPTMLDLIATDDIHPCMAPVVLEFRKLLSRSYFSRSNSTAQSKAGHYSLHVDSYTWASSPIRRYLDLVVQRQLHAVLFKEPVLYSADDIEFLCHDFNRKNLQAQAYEKRAHSLQMATQLRSQVLQKVAFVVSVEAASRHFRALFPLNKDSLPDPQLLNYRSLQLAEQPTFFPEQGSVRLTWRRRMYSVATSKNRSLQPGPLRAQDVTLFSARAWQDVLTAVQEEDFDRVTALLQEAQGWPLRPVGRVGWSKCSHYMELGVELSAGNVLRLQLTTHVHRGFLVPFVQLWSVAPGFDVCLEHTEKPIDCFSAYATQASKDSYASPEDYARVWQPLSAMESASCAVAENDSIILHDVKITWAQKRTCRGQRQGSFCLPYDFLKECAIEVDFSNCYLCVRLAGLQLGGLPRPEDALSQRLQDLRLSGETAADGKLVIDPATYTWVAHGLTEDSSADGKSDRKGQETVNFYVHFLSMDEVSAEISQDNARFTVELIPKMLPDVRKEMAIGKLKYSSDLAKSIALGHETPERGRHRPPQDLSVQGKDIVWGFSPCLCWPSAAGWDGCLESRCEVFFVFNVPVINSKLLVQKTFDLPGSCRKLNQSQNSAIQAALRKSFTLIQGPPGTGKTVVGTHIVYWFHKLNQETLEKEAPLKDEEKSRKCILYCGPSNKSVDVVAEMLLKMRPDPKPLRVYGEAVESMDYPYPGSTRLFSRKALRDTKSKPELRHITLHHRIREPPNPQASKIREFDVRFRKGEQVTDEELRRYKGLLSSGRTYELKSHDVILCTCSAASASSLVEVLNVRQILIDECAMSTEPETLIPLVSYKRADKVVLLGDHKQLRPVVNNDFCKTLGLETSLFERYQSQALMLDTQYRMHADICKFPSQEFYKGRLKTCPTLHRQPSILFHRNKACCPVIFGHIEGKEQSLMVSTEEGNENSRANLEEVEQAVRIAKQLTLDGSIKPQSIAVLSPYNAQVSEINKRLTREGIRDITVCSIMKSQGSEWKYVILSTVRSRSQSEIERKPTKSWQKKFLGFVTDPNQVNVGLTRAQEGLCIIGEYGLGPITQKCQKVGRFMADVRGSSPAEVCSCRTAGVAKGCWVSSPAPGSSCTAPEAEGYCHGDISISTTPCHFFKAVCGLLAAQW
uniref:Helicase with zinc finger 2 n=1 Tax=Crocodylus porosus TaxID=8502 RepID=A0A7M4EGY0_CROPO